MGEKSRVVRASRKGSSRRHEAASASIRLRPGRRPQPWIGAAHGSPSRTRPPGCQSARTGPRRREPDWSESASRERASRERASRRTEPAGRRSRPEPGSGSQVSQSQESQSQERQSQDGPEPGRAGARRARARTGQSPLRRGGRERGTGHGMWSEVPRPEERHVPADCRRCRACRRCRSPVPPAPPWGRVLATTLRLWLQRRSARALGLAAVAVAVVVFAAGAVTVILARHPAAAGPPRDRLSRAAAPLPSRRRLPHAARRQPG